MHRAALSALLALLLVVPVTAPTSELEAPAYLDPSLQGLGPGPVSAIVQFTSEADASTLRALDALGTIHQRYTVIDGAHVIPSLLVAGVRRVIPG